MSAIDLRSDAALESSDGIRAALASVGRGMSVRGAASRELEEHLADTFGMESAAFVPTGTLANVLAIKVVASPGSEVICESHSHMVRAESGSLAVMAGVTTRTWSDPRGLVNNDAIEQLIAHRSDPWFIPTAAVSVENTHSLGGGSVQSSAALERLFALSRRADFLIHVDGARIWNALVATGTPPRRYGELTDVLSVSMAKGLGAPVGAAILGSKELISTARVWRKRLGGELWNADPLASAGLWAIRNHLGRLEEDHHNARSLAAYLAERVPGRIDPTGVQTNMVLVDVGDRHASDITRELEQRGVLVGTIGSRTLRLVTHMNATDRDCMTAAREVVRALTVSTR